MSEWYIHQPWRVDPTWREVDLLALLPVGLTADTVVDVMLRSGNIITHRAGGFLWYDVGTTSIVMWRRAGE